MGLTELQLASKAKFGLFLDVRSLFFMNNTSPSLYNIHLFMTSTGLVIQEKTCNMIKFLESSQLTIIGLTEAGE